MSMKYNAIESLTDFEKKSLFAILEKTNHLEYLNQLKFMNMIARTFSWKWFFLDFELKDASAIIVADLKKKRILNGDVTVILKGWYKLDVGFLVFTENGIITFMEWFTYIEDWPKEDELTTNIQSIEASEGKDSPYNLEDNA